ncbi:hypothetical protein, partial [Streptomyces gibsoniae]
MLQNLKKSACWLAAPVIAILAVIATPASPAAAAKPHAQPGSTGLMPVDGFSGTKKCLVTCDDGVSLGPHQARSARHFRD